MRVVTWNLEWAPRSRRERQAARIAALAPDVLCLTEADAGMLPAGGHSAECEADAGYGVRADRRKAIIWSRWPLEDIDRVGDPEMPPGRFVAATCRTPDGPVRLVGVCIPWSLARVRTAGRTAWEDHLAYLARLGPLIEARDPAVPLVVLGDFNQYVPRRRAPVRAAEALAAALADLTVATAGEVPGLGAQVIDHVAHCDLLDAREVVGLDRHGEDGRPLSDHHAVAVELRRRDG